MIMMMIDRGSAIYRSRIEWAVHDLYQVSAHTYLQPWWQLAMLFEASFQACTTHGPQGVPRELLISLIIVLFKVWLFFSFGNSEYKFPLLYAPLIGGPAVHTALAGHVFAAPMV